MIWEWFLCSGFVAATCQCLLAALAGLPPSECGLLGKFLQALFFCNCGGFAVFDQTALPQWTSGERSNGAMSSL
jgi:hypothetical protein